MKIAPSILSADFAALGEAVARVEAGGADQLHVEACTHLNRILHQIREAGAKAGVALNPSTPPGAIEWVLDDLDLVLVMSVNPGFGGQAFIPSSYAKVRQVKSLIGTRPVEISV